MPPSCLPTEDKNARSDDPDTRYLKMMGPASRYSIIEYGICLWTAASASGSSDTDDVKYTAQPFNFYLFPKSGGDMCLQPASIDFLRQNNMDFGMWFNKGITYVDRRQAGWLKNRFTVKELTPVEPAAGAADAPNHDVVVTKPADIEFVERQKVKILAFMADADAEATSVQLDTCNNYLRKVLYQYLERNHPVLTLESVKVGYHSAILCKKLSESDRIMAHEAKIAEQLKKLQEELGFTRVYTAMCAAGKPIVGHNCFFDCLFTMAKLDGFLPPTLSDLTSAFAEKGRTPFGRMIDTKYLCHSGLLTDRAFPNNGDTALGKLYEVLKESDLVNINVVKEGDKELGVQLHNAAYDAYITGCVFAHMLGDKAFQPTAASKTNGVPQHTLALNNLVEQAAGRLFMMQSMYHMDVRVGQADPASAMMHGWLKESGTLYHLYFENPSVGETDIFNVFCATGIDKQRIELCWSHGIDTSVLVLLKPPVVKVLVTAPSTPGTPGASAAASHAAPATPAATVATAATSAEEQVEDTEHYVTKLELPANWKVVSYVTFKASIKEAQAAAAAAAAMARTTTNANTSNVSHTVQDSKPNNFASKIFRAAAYVPNLLWSGFGSVIGSYATAKRTASTEEAEDSPCNKRGRTS